MPRRVLQVLDSLDGGGAESHVVDLSLALAERGAHVVVACSAAGRHRDVLLAAGVEVEVVADRLVKRTSSPSYAAGLAELVGRLRPDLVHAHMHASEVAAAEAVPHDTPLVLTEHTEAPWRDDLDWAHVRRAGRRADRVLAVSTAVAEGLQRRGVPPGRVRVLLPAVRTHPPAPAALEPGLPRPLVGVVARLVPSKGVDVLLAALAEVPGAGCLVVGDGPERARLRAAAAGLGDRVRFAGWRSDARDLLAGLDVLVVPSRSDGSPLVVMEALSAGVPVVASRVGGLPDQLVDGSPLVPPGDAGALAAALRGLLADPERRAALGRAGRVRAAERSHEAMVDALEQVYDEAAEHACVRAVPLPRPVRLVSAVSSAVAVRPSGPAWSRTGAAPAR